VRRVCAVVVNAVGGRKHEDYIRMGLMGFSFFNGLSFLRPVVLLGTFTSATLPYSRALYLYCFTLLLLEYQTSGHCKNE
jgi:hypothetical protein